MNGFNSITEKTTLISMYVINVCLDNSARKKTPLDYWNYFIVFYWNKFQFNLIDIGTFESIWGW